MNNRSTGEVSLQTQERIAEAVYVVKVIFTTGRARNLTVSVIKAFHCNELKSCHKSPDLCITLTPVSIINL